MSSSSTGVGKGIFAGQHVCISGMQTGPAEQLLTQLQANGADASREFYAHTSTILIMCDPIINGSLAMSESRARNPKYQEALKGGLLIVRPEWVPYCLRRGSMVVPEPHEIGQPLPILPIPTVFDGPLAGEKVSSTGLAQPLSAYIAYRVACLGGTYSGQLDETVTVLLANCLDRKQAPAAPNSNLMREVWSFIQPKSVKIDFALQPRPKPIPILALQVLTEVLLLPFERRKDLLGSKPQAVWSLKQAHAVYNMKTLGQRCSGDAPPTSPSALGPSTAMQLADTMSSFPAHKPVGKGPGTSPSAQFVAPTGAALAASSMTANKAMIDSIRSDNSNSVPMMVRVPTKDNSVSPEAKKSRSKREREVPVPVAVDCTGVRVWLIGHSANGELRARATCLRFGIIRLPHLSSYLCTHIVVGPHISISDDARLRQWVEAEEFPTNRVVTAQWLLILESGGSQAQALLGDNDRGMCQHIFRRRRQDPYGGNGLSAPSVMAMAELESKPEGEAATAFGYAVSAQPQEEGDAVTDNARTKTPDRPRRSVDGSPKKLRDTLTLDRSKAHQGQSQTAQEVPLSLPLRPSSRPLPFALQSVPQPTAQAPSMTLESVAKDVYLQFTAPLPYDTYSAPDATRPVARLRSVSSTVFVAEGNPRYALVDNTFAKLHRSIAKALLGLGGAKDSVITKVAAIQHVTEGVIAVLPHFDESAEAVQLPSALHPVVTLDWLLWQLTLSRAQILNQGAHASASRRPLLPSNPLAFEAMTMLPLRGPTTALQGMYCYTIVLVTDPALGPAAHGITARWVARAGGFVSSDFSIVVNKKDTFEVANYDALDTQVVTHVLVVDTIGLADAEVPSPSSLFLPPQVRAAIVGGSQPIPVIGLPAILGKQQSQLAGYLEGVQLKSYAKKGLINVGRSKEISANNQQSDSNIISPDREDFSDDALSAKLENSLLLSELKKPRGTHKNTKSVPALDGPKSLLDKDDSAAKPRLIYIVSTLKESEALKEVMANVCRSHSEGLPIPAGRGGKPLPLPTTYAITQNVENADVVITNQLSMRESVMIALAGGCLLLKPSYIQACEQKNMIVSMAEHEWTAADAPPSIDGPKERSRYLEVLSSYERLVRRGGEGAKPHLFEGKTYLLLTVTSAAKDNGHILQTVLAKGGGRIVSSVDMADLLGMTELPATDEGQQYTDDHGHLKLADSMVSAASELSKAEGKAVPTTVDTRTTITVLATSECFAAFAPVLSNAMALLKEKCAASAPTTSRAATKARKLIRIEVYNASYIQCELTGKKLPRLLLEGEMCPEPPTQ